MPTRMQRQKTRQHSPAALTARPDKRARTSRREVDGVGGSPPTSAKSINGLRTSCRHYDRNHSACRQRRGPVTAGSRQCGDRHIRRPQRICGPQRIRIVGSQSLRSGRRADVMFTTASHFLHKAQPHPGDVGDKNAGSGAGDGRWQRPGAPPSTARRETRPPPVGRETG